MQVLIFMFNLLTECPENKCGKFCDKVCHCQEPVSTADKISGVCSNGCTGRWVSANGTTGLCNLGLYWYMYM